MSVTVTVTAADGATTQVVLPAPVINQPAPAPGGVEHYVATLTLSDGTAYTFDSASAVDQGDYVGAFVRQKSLMVVLPGCPFTVFFRPDVDGKRDEVVVELGKMWSGTPAHVTTPYTFSVTKDGASVLTQTVPYHWWWSRWRWQSASRPFVRDAASLMASKHFLPHSKDYLYGYAPSATAGAYAYNTTYAYTPMSVKGICNAFGSPGDRPELGPVTKAQSDFILFGTPLAKDVMVAQAEVSASLPFHVRDEKTGAWLNNQAKPYFSLNPRSAAPLIPTPPAPLPQTPNFAYLESSHMPPLSYVPYMLMDDPYLLEELQAVALYHIVEGNDGALAQKLPGKVQAGEVRSTAWGVLAVAQAAKVTPATVPGWLLPQSLWIANLADNRTYLQRFIDSPARVHQLFRAYPRSDTMSGFQDDYKMIAMAWVARMFPEWKDAHAWAIACILPFVSANSGWPRGWPCPYYPKTFNTATLPGRASDGGVYSWVLVTTTAQDSLVYATYEELFKRYVDDKGNTSDPTLVTYPPAWDGVNITQTPLGLGYPSWRLGALVLAQGLGVTGATEPVTWIAGQMPLLQKKYGGTSDPRWSFDKAN